MSSRASRWERAPVHNAKHVVKVLCVASMGEARDNRGGPCLANQLLTAGRGWEGDLRLRK